MPPAPIPTPIQALAPGLARRVTLIAAGLAALVAHRFLREPRLASLIVPLWTLLTRTANRFERLMTGLAANRPQKPRPTNRRRPAPDTARPALLPAGHGWLIRALPHEAAAYAAQLEALLAEPATADLLAASPAAARLLRPLGRMLGLSAFTPKRTPPNRRPQAATPSVAPHRAPVPPPPPLASLPRNEHWPSETWPTAYRPSANWPAACRRRAAPA